MKGGDFAGIHFGTLGGTNPLLTNIARGVRFLGRETVALFAKHPEMAMLKRYATALHKDYLSRIDAYSYKLSSHSFWWAEKRLFEAYYSDRLRREHLQKEKHEINIKRGM